MAEEYMSSWNTIDAGAPGVDEGLDFIEGRPPVASTVDPVLFYPSLSPHSPENRLTDITPFTKLAYSYLPGFIKEADEVQDPQNGAWPMLRFMDAIGHIADGVRETVDQMNQGVWTDPARVPDRAVPWLASVLGVPASQKRVPIAQLREALAYTVESGRAPTGTRDELAAATRQFLIGTRQVLVTSQVGQPRVLTQPDLDLAAAVGYGGRVINVWVSPAPPLPDKVTVDDLWVDEDGRTVWTRDAGNTTWTQYTATNVTALIDAAVTARVEERLRRAHTIVIVVRPDDVPNGDLPGLAAKLRSVGLIPAGHALLIVTAISSWDSFEAELAAAGGDWNAYERVTAVWADDEALGLADFGGQ